MTRASSGYPLPAARPGRARAAASVPVAATVTATVALLALGAFALGRTLAPALPSPAAIEAHGALPIGVKQSPAGALAAADDYLAVEQASVEQEPELDAQLIDAVYAPAIRGSELDAAAADRARDPQGMTLWARGGQNLSGVAARRLDWYHGNAAQVSAWAFNVFWGPDRPPKQGWVLVQTVLRWNDGRWLVAAIRPAPTPAPAPALTPQAAGANDSLGLFDGALAGFAAPIEGVAAR